METNKRIQDSFFLWQRYLIEKRCPEEANVITGWLAVGMVQVHQETMNTQPPFAPCSVMDNRYWWQGFYHLAIKKKCLGYMRMTFLLVEENTSDFWTIVCCNRNCPPETRQLIDQGAPLYHCQLRHKVNRFLRTLTSYQFHFQSPASTWCWLYNSSFSMQTKGKDTVANEKPGIATGHSKKAKAVLGLQDSL